jgi:ABC-2 type transport system permease protein
MRKFFILLERELKSYFYSPVAYIVLCFFLFIAGFNFYTSVILLNRGPVEITFVEMFFNNAIFWFGVLLLIPLITMRLYSEEFKLGTIETLMTAPVEDWQVVASKFAGSLLFYLTLWAPTVLLFALYQWVTKETAAASLGSLGGSYLLITVMGTFYLSLGCLASVLTRNQIVAAVVCTVIVIVFFFTGFLGMALPNVSQGFRDFVAYFSTILHMREYARGMIDTRAIVFYLTMTVFLQFLTFQAFQYRKWKF